jgi:Mitochondrial carrier protein
MILSKKQSEMANTARSEASPSLGKIAELSEVRDTQHPAQTFVTNTHQVQSTATMDSEPLLVRVKRNVSQPFAAAFMAGGVAGAVSRTVVSPLERLKILYQVQSVGRNEYQMSIYKALRKMWTEEGWRGFMRGNGTNCVRIIPYSAVQFGSYNIYKRVRERS